MIWRMKNFNILGVDGKMWVLGEGGGVGVTKNQYIGGDCLKMGAWTVCRFKRVGAWQERGGWCFRGGIDSVCWQKFLIL